MIEPYTAVALQTPHHNCQPPQDRPVRDKYLQESVRRLQERGVYTPPAHGRGRDDLGVDVPGGAQSRVPAGEKP